MRETTQADRISPWLEAESLAELSAAFQSAIEAGERPDGAAIALALERLGHGSRSFQDVLSDMQAHGLDVRATGLLRESLAVAAAQNGQDMESATVADAVSALSRGLAGLNRYMEQNVGNIQPFLIVTAFQTMGYGDTELGTLMDALYDPTTQAGRAARQAGLSATELWQIEESFRQALGRDPWPGRDAWEFRSVNAAAHLLQAAQDVAQGVQAAPEGPESRALSPENQALANIVEELDRAFRQGVEPSAHELLAQFSMAGYAFSTMTQLLHDLGDPTASVTMRLSELGLGITYKETLIATLRDTLAEEDQLTWITVGALSDLTRPPEDQMDFAMEIADGRLLEAYPELAEQVEAWTEHLATGEMPSDIPPIQVVEQRATGRER